MSRSYEVQAVAPAQGLRVQLGDDSVTLRLFDDGGRGWPWAVIFIPVREVAGHLQAVINGQPTAPTYTRAQLLGASQWVALKQENPPPTTLTRTQWVAKHTGTEPWPFDADSVLALLLYFALPNVGGLLPVDDAGEGGQPFDAYWIEVTRAVNSALTLGTADDLRGGLMRRAVSVSPPLAAFD